MKNFLKYTSILKHLPRTGWLQHGIEIPETVASHSWQMAMMAMQLSGTMLETPYDFDKVIKLCLCHDLGESVIGDITPSDACYNDKFSREKSAICTIAQRGDIPQLILLYEEYEQNLTPEAKLAHDIDQLDMVAQSLDYEAKYQGKDLSEFRINAKKKIKTPLGQAIYKELVEKTSKN